MKFSDPRKLPGLPSTRATAAKSTGSSVRMRTVLRMEMAYKDQISGYVKSSFGKKSESISKS